MVSACACVGPAGDCPCIRMRNGLPVKIVESQISKKVFDCLPDEDKRTINDLKLKAAAIYLSRRNLTE